MTLTTEVLGERLREARKRAGLSQEEVASELEVPRSAVSKIERGQQSVDSIQLRRLSDLYGVSLDSLLEPEEEKTTDEAEFVQALRRGGEQSDVNPRDVSRVEEFCEYYRWLHREVSAP